MRPRIVLALVAGFLICLVLAVWPFQAATRYVGLGGLVLYGSLLLAERRWGYRRRS